MFGLKVKSTLFILGTTHYLTQFFSNVCVNLENGNRGSRFPIIMNELYWGEISPENISNAVKEIRSIAEELKRVPKSKFIYDFMEPNTRMPEGMRANENATNLYDYMVNFDDDRVVPIITHALESAERRNCKVRLESFGEA